MLHAVVVVVAAAKSTTTALLQLLTAGLACLTAAAATDTAKHLPLFKQNLRFLPYCIVLAVSALATFSQACVARVFSSKARKERRFRKVRQAVLCQVLLAVAEAAGALFICFYLYRV